MAYGIRSLSTPLGQQEKLEILQGKLGTDDLESVLDKSLNIANYIADTVQDPHSHGSDSSHVTPVLGSALGLYFGSQKR